MAVTGIATNAGTLARVFLVYPNSKRYVKWFQSHPCEIIRQMLYALFVTDGGVLVRRTGPRLTRVFAAIAVHLVKMFCFCVVRLQLVVTDWPGRRNPAVMSNLTKVFL